jgi:YVTN family beta-propeller protein
MRRRNFLSLAAAASLESCSKPKVSGFPGYAFVANQEGKAVAAVDLSAFAVARHIPIDGRPSEILAHPTEQKVFTLTPENGTIHEIDSANLKFSRLWKAGQPLSHIRLSGDGRTIYALTTNPNRLLELNLADWKPGRSLPLPAPPVDFDVSPLTGFGVISFGASSAPILIHLDSLKIAAKLTGEGQYAIARFQSNGKAIMAGDQEKKMLSIFSVPEGNLVSHLSLAVRPDYWCFKNDGGQLFLAGEGSGTVAIIYPYRTEVAETILAGSAPRGMTTVTTQEVDYLFVASPHSGDVTILNIATHKVIAVVAVGKNPVFLMPTPDNEFVLVLNQQSGDMAVIRVKSITRNRAKLAPLFNLIPVGSKPVAAVVKKV